MKPGSVIVDLAAEQGGNVEGTRVGEIVDVNGVKVIGAAEPGRDRSPPMRRRCTRATCSTSSRCRSNAKTGEFAIPRDDEIVKATMVVDNGAVVPRGG